MCVCGGVCDVCVGVWGGVCDVCVGVGGVCDMCLFVPKHGM